MVRLATGWKTPMASATPPTVIFPCALATTPCRDPS
jgi:hypothetical protein